jgi:hypothetical protein
VKYEEMFNVVNSNAWAEFVDGAIRLYQGSDQTAIYHEAWHAFSQHFLTQEEKAELYGEIGNTEAGEAAIRKWAKDNGKLEALMTGYQKALAVEELIAEDFRKYMMSGGKEILSKRRVRNNVFRRILNFFKKIFGELGLYSYSHRGPFMLEELYEKLRVGNINMYTPSEKNAFFTQGLYKTITPVEGEDTQISDQDAMLLVESMDAIISEYVDKENERAGDTRFSSALFNHPEIVLFNEDGLQEVYLHIKQRFEEQAKNWETVAETSEGLEKEQFLKKANLLKDALRNFGGPTEGLISFHLDKSPFLGEKTKNIDKDKYAKTKSDIDAVRFDKSGNELSMMDLASNQVLYLVKSLKKYDKEGNVEINSLGFPKLADYRQSWVKLVNLLAESNNSPKDIKIALEEAAPNSPWIYDLLDKLGDVNTTHGSTFDLWTAFWAAFNLDTQGLYQVSVSELNERTPGTDEITTTHEVLVGYASAVFRQVERDFKSYFKSVRDSEFLKDTKAGNILDYKVLDKYRGNLENNEFEFLVDIGFPLSDTTAIREGLKSVNVDFIYAKLDELSKHNEPIFDVIKALKDPYEKQGEVRQGNAVFQSTVVSIPSETTNVNKILNLQARHSGLYANTGVSTPDGKVKFEQSQMSTLAVLKREINSAESFQQLIEKPHMAYLRYENNPAVTSSIWLKSLFEFNEITQTFGKKRPGVKLMSDDMGGTQTIIDQNHPDYNYSSATSKSDRYTRLLQDIYSSLLGGRFATITPSDKSTILGVRVTQVDSGTESKSKHLYVDMSDFLTDGAQVNLAIENAFRLLLPYIGSELMRIQKIKAQDGSVPSIPGYTVEDKKGNITGDKLSVFDNVFSDITNQKILDKGTYEALLEDGDLLSDMLRDMKNYFAWSSQNTKETLGRMIFVDNNLKNYMEEEVGKKLTNEQAQDLMVKAYTVNSFIHHLEGFTLLYGDLAQYKDISKRNYGVQSTGRMFRTDQEAMDYVNNVLGRPYREKVLGDTGKTFNGTMDTIVLKEASVPSVYYGIYVEELTNHYKSLGIKDARAKAEATLDPYVKMDEGDAQGWITFDTYRILSKLSGRWTMEQEILFKKIIDTPELVKIGEVMEYFPPRKYQYFGPLDVSGVSATAFHKYSLFPMIPTVIKGKNLEKLHNQMMTQNIDYAVFDSGSKVATVVAPGRKEGDELYSDL